MRQRQAQPPRLLNEGVRRWTLAGPLNAAFACRCGTSEGRAQLALGLDAVAPDINLGKLRVVG